MLAYFDMVAVLWPDFLAAFLADLPFGEVAASRDSACAARWEASLTALVSCGLLFITVSSMT